MDQSRIQHVSERNKRHSSIQEVGRDQKMSIAKKVLGDYVLVTETKKQVTSKSGLELSAEDSDKLRYKQGIVEQAGEDVNSLEPKDEIYYDSRAGFSMMVKGVLYTLIKERDISVVL